MKDAIADTVAEVPKGFVKLFCYADDCVVSEEHQKKTKEENAVSNDEDLEKRLLHQRHQNDLNHAEYSQFKVAPEVQPEKSSEKSPSVLQHTKLQNQGRDAHQTTSQLHAEHEMSVGDENDGKAANAHRNSSQ